MKLLYLSSGQLHVLVRSTFLRLVSGLEEYLRSGLSRHEETNHEQGEALGVAVPPLGCDSAAPLETLLFRVLS